MGKFGTGNLAHQPNDQRVNQVRQPLNQSMERSLFENSFNSSSNFIPIASLNSNMQTWKIKAKLETK